MTMTRDKMKSIVRSHYGLTLPITDRELDAEIANLKLRIATTGLDDLDQQLASRLQISEVGG